MPPFIFDFTLEKPTMKYVPEQEEGAQRGPSSIICDGSNLCPYPIPKVEEIIKEIERANIHVGKDKFLSDLLECGAIAISNQVDLAQFNTREERYLQIINNYQPNDRAHLVNIFSKIFALLSSVVYDNGIFNDYLGEIFMRTNAGNKKTGQFFTPYHISKFMATVTILEDIVQNKKETDDILTVNDPCCGGGGMLIAALDVLRDNKFNYARNCFMDAGDIDIRCVHMTYLQLSLAGVPAIVRHQNALTRELWSVWYTPAYIFQFPRFQKYVNLN